MNKITRREGLKGLSLFLTAVVVLFSVTSCMSPEAVESYILRDGRQQYFIHTVPFKYGSQCRGSIDMTVHVRDSAIADPVTVNYTLSGRPWGVAADQVTLSFEWADDAAPLQSVHLLFKDMSPPSTRFTSALDPVSFRKIVNSSSPLVLCITLPDGAQKRITMEKLHRSVRQFSDVL